MQYQKNNGIKNNKNLFSLKYFYLANICKCQFVVEVMFLFLFLKLKGVSTNNK